MAKVALCISGKVGNIQGHTGLKKSDFSILNKGFYHYKKHIIDKNDADVFIHCWDKEFEEEILKLYKPKKYIFEEQKLFKIPRYVRGSQRPWQFKNAFIRNQSTYSKWYSNKIVNSLRREYEEEVNMKYDFVMTTRFDIAFEKDVIFNQFNNQYFYAGNWTIVKDENGIDIFKAGLGPLYELISEDRNILNKLNFDIQGYPKNANGLLDFWFFTNSEYSTQFFDLFDYLDEYNKPLNCPLSQDESKLISNHQLALYHLQKLNLGDKLKFAFDLYDDFPVIRRKYFGEKIKKINTKRSKFKRFKSFINDIFYFFKD